MVGSKEEEIANIDLDPSEIPEVINDFDDNDNLEDIQIHNREENLIKIEKRISSYKFTILNEPREGKKLLVLDIDYTLFGKTSLICHHNFFLLIFKLYIRSQISSRTCITTCQTIFTRVFDQCLC